jgi:hypothetical protein
MEKSVNQSEEVQTIKTPSLIDRAVAIVSKDGRANTVQASGTIRASLMSVVAYIYCSEQGVSQLQLEENGVNIHRTVEHENDHAVIFQWGSEFPRPLHGRDGVFRCIIKKLEDGGCIVSAMSIEHEQVPPRDGVVRVFARRLMRFSPITPTTTRFTSTSVFDLGGSIPRFVSASFTTPSAARTPLSTLRYFNQMKRTESFEAADGTELGHLLVLDTNEVRRKTGRRPLEAKLARVVDRHAVLRRTRGRFTWFEGMLVEVLRNQVKLPSKLLAPLAEYGEEEGRRVGGAFGRMQLKKVSPAAAVEGWIAAYPALGDLKRE